MNNILVIANGFPQADKASGYLRFYTLLTLLARKYRVIFCALNDDGTIQPPNEAAALLEDAGITLGKVDFPHVIKHHKPDIVWFEFYYQARKDYVALLRRNCPDARIVVDSVDVHFNRLEARARLTGNPEDEAKARDMKERELAAYERADMVIAVSEDDRKLIQRELPTMPIEVIPNVHDVPDFPDPNKRQHGELVFVGGFNHDPNIDAMVYFCRDVMPLITASCPEARLKIIGSNAPQAIHELASEHVEVLGYVPHTAPYLESASISVAPLRYGGGMKGKVGEAMSYGLPVVTTSFGAEGFGLEPGRDLLIGDTPESFAAQVISLLNDPDLSKRTGKNGYDFIARHYSVPAVEQILDASLANLDQLPQRRIPLAHQLMFQMQNLYSRHIAWRLPK
jgi:glycosyltransferase involved in cell wall biosynthesis